ncbi:MAG: 3-phosphoserine/phosphohydroxythreonine transaminase [Chitinophagaceae bacterium]|nr:3-phosphoserine/phosphohydroxythreonine transaminase [Chitinophagaceae bacterium]
MIYSGKVINLNAGPAALPQLVLQQAAEAVLNYEHTGMSVLSIPHRGVFFNEILEESKALVKELCGLNDDYEVLWMHGGGRLQFAMIPMNFLGEGQTAGYVDSGSWAADAIKHAEYYGKVSVLSSSKKHGYQLLPDWPAEIPADLAYLHITTNNTIYGTQWPGLPHADVPLIADMSSDIFSRLTDYTNCTMFYAVAQKNIGPAGATLVVMRKDMLQRIGRKLPPMLSYAQHAAKNSVLNTPPVFAIYVSLLTLRWIKNKGIATIEEENKIKATLLYDEVERNALFSTTVQHSDRSMMNVCFRAVNEKTGELFNSFCTENGILNIKGHRSVGGFRASLYNAISVEDVKYVVAAMQEFELNNKL